MSHFQAALTNELPRCGGKVQCSQRFRGVLSHGPETARPFLSNLVDAVGEGDAALLDELERLVRDKQARTRQEPE